MTPRACLTELALEVNGHWDVDFEYALRGFLIYLEATFYLECFLYDCRHGIEIDLCTILYLSSVRQHMS